MLRDEADDLDRQSVLVAQVDAVPNVARDDAGARLGREVVVDVVRPRLFSMKASGFFILPMSW